MSAIDCRYAAMTWNLPNILTLLRLPLLFAILAVSEFNFPKPFTIVLVLVILSMVTDFLDGFLARKLNLVSNFGKIADPLFDKLFILGLMIWMLAIDIIPSWNVVIVLLLLLRELAVTGLRGGGSSGKKTFGADWYGKWKTTLLFVSLFLFVIGKMLSVDYGVSGGLIQGIFWLGIATLWIGSLLGIYSGIRYFRLYT